jgi:hypothetical protein
VKTDTHRGRRYDAFSTHEQDGAYRGGFDVDSTEEGGTDGVINEATPTTFPSPEAAEAAAVVAAQHWIDREADKT